jgi:hypothetical protein
MQYKSFMCSVWNSLLVGDITTAVGAWMEFKTSAAYDQKPIYSS